MPENINTLFSNKPKFPGEYKTIGDKSSCDWKIGLTPSEINELNASRFDVNNDELSCQWGHKLSYLPPIWLKNNHTLNPLYMLHKVPYIRIPDKLGGSSLDLNPYLKQLPFTEQVRVKRMTFYYGMFIDDGKNKSSSLCAYPCFNHGAYYKGKFVYVYIDKKAADSNCCDIPLIPTVTTPKINAQASNLNWTDFIDEFINWFST